MFDRDEQEISQIVERGLEAIQSGQATLEQVLAQRPEQAEVIRAELEAALWLVARREEVAPRVGYVAASRRRVVERIQAEASSHGTRRALFGFAWPQQIAFQWVVTVVVLMAAADRRRQPADGIAELAAGGWVVRGQAGQRAGVLYGHPR